MIFVISGMGFPAAATSTGLLENLHIGSATIRVAHVDSPVETETGSDAESARFVPGFQIRGFEGDVKKEETKTRAIALGIVPPGKSAGDSLVVIKLVNTSDDIIAVTGFEPVYSSGAIPWQPGITFPLDLDTGEGVELFAASADQYVKLKTIEIRVNLEIGAGETWIISAVLD